MHVLYLLLLFFALQPRYVAPAPTNVSLPDLANSFWMATGLKMPSKEYIEAVQRAKLPVIDSHGRRRDIVLVTLASEFAFQRLFGVFLQSLANITFVRSNGQQDNLARHMVINVMTLSSTKTCEQMAGKYGAHCVAFGNPSFSLGNFDVHSNDFYGIGFVKTATILDGLTLGVDVLFLDADQVLFQNPLPYLIARDSDIMVSGDCHNHDDTAPQERLAPVGNNIGFVYFRPTPMVVRVVYNWAFWLASLARNGGQPWDQHTFAPAMDETAVAVTMRHLNLVMLRTELFPYRCMGPCGCDLRNVPYFHRGKVPGRPAGGDCDPYLVNKWYNYHFPCAGDMNVKAALMEEYVGMYQRVVGPINSKSAPFQVLDS